MYLDYFELKEAPFSITPDPRFVFLTAQHRDAMAHLLFGIAQGGGGGFVQLTGEVGTGKTTLCRLLMAQVPEHVRIALVLNPMQQPIELLRTICDELRILLPKRTSSIKTLTDALTRYLLEAYASGLRVVVVLDEAQNLSFEALEQVRLLTNLETPTQKLLQIILLGQPELRELLARSDLRQLAQRITARFHLAPLDEGDTAAYVEHRLTVAGRRRPLFTPSALREVFRRTRGYPRSINVLCDRAMLGGYARALAELDESIVKLADEEIRGMPAPKTKRSFAPLAVTFLVFLGLAVTVMWFIGNAQVAPDVAITSPELADKAATPTYASINDFAGFDNSASAIDAVAKTWAPDASVTSAACITAGSALCARLRLNPTALLELNRPAVLEVGRAKTRKLLVLRHIDGRNAAVSDARLSAILPLSALEAQWFGDAWIAATAPDGYTGEVLAPGSVGDHVAFVHRAMALTDRDASDLNRFDDRTSRHVVTLQDRFGLRADGLVGPETMALMVALASGGPHLDDPVDANTFVSGSQR